MENLNIYKPKLFVIENRFNGYKKLKQVSNSIVDYVKKSNLKDFCVITHLRLDVFTVQIYSGGKLVEKTAKNVKETMEIFAKNVNNTTCICNGFSRTVMGSFIRNAVSKKLTSSQEQIK